MLFEHYEKNRQKTNKNPYQKNIWQKDKTFQPINKNSQVPSLVALPVGDDHSVP